MTAFWLRPAAEERECLESLIARLAREFDAPVFEPHVTLFAERMGERRALEILQSLPSSPDVHLEVERIAFSSEFTKTLFVQFRPGVEASSLSGAISEAAGSRGGYVFDPHLSLLYRQMERAVQEALADRIEIAKRSMVFDSLSVVACPPLITRRADVEAWRTLGERPLTGKSGSHE